MLCCKQCFYYFNKSTVYLVFLIRKEVKKFILSFLITGYLIAGTSTPTLNSGWNLLGNISNDIQIISSENISISWIFSNDTGWIKDSPIPSGSGF